MDGQADCEAQCNSNAECLGFVDMSSRGWGYMLKNYVGPDCLETRSGFVLHLADDENDGGDPKYFYHAATAATAAVNAIVDWDEKAQCSRPQLLPLLAPAPSHMRHSVGAGVQRRFPL